MRNSNSINWKASIYLCVIAAVSLLLNISAAPADDNKTHRTTVKVGGYTFPPYVQESNGEFTGLTLDMIEMMNAFQGKYRFVFVPTSPMRRYEDFKNGVYDMIFFESMDWGWEGMEVEASKVFAKDYEVFVAAASRNQDQHFFDILQDKSLLVYLGYHYPFAGYNSDPAYLLERFNARTTVSHEANIRSVIANRADLAVVTKSYLSKFLMNNPSLIPKIMISDRIEQVYNHTILVKKGISPSAETINKLIQALEQPGYISILLGKYGIEPTGSMDHKQKENFQAKKSTKAPKSKGKIVRVGGYHFPPYVEHHSGEFSGLTLDLLELLNAYQDKYRFEFVPTTPLTRYKDFDENLFDMLFFERKEWGWEKENVAPTKEFLKDYEVYVTNLAPGKNQDYFNDVQGKLLLGYLGYHYPVVDYITEPSVLLNKYGMKVTSSHKSNIRSVLNGEADLAIVTRSFVTRFLRNNPSLIPRLLISKNMVQEYKHTMLIRKDFDPDPGAISNLLDELEKTGYVDFLWGKYDVQPISEEP